MHSVLEVQNILSCRPDSISKMIFSFRFVAQSIRTFQGCLMPRTQNFNPRKWNFNPISIFSVKYTQNNSFLTVNVAILATGNRNHLNFAIIWFCSISSVNSSDAREWKCIATNEVGCDPYFSLPYRNLYYKVEISRRCCILSIFMVYKFPKWP